ncbi:MAG: nucleotidyltransferase domain-containing protein [Candidatus Heimdallarchaeota archaeon]
MKLILSLNERDGSRIISERLKKLRPNPKEEIATAGKIMDKIVKKLQAVRPFNLAEIRMVGSLRKNTMVSSRKELDVVVSLPANQITNYPPKEETRTKLKRQIARIFKVEEPDEYHQNVRIEESGWKLDILPTFKISVENFIKKTKKEKGVYKPHMSLYHVKFIEKRGQKFQEFCRLAKYWTNGPEYKIEKQRYTSSFFIELIAAAVFDDANSKWNLVNLFEAFLIRVKNLKSKKRYIAFSDFYNKNEFKKNWVDKLSVIDPADPDDNIAKKNPQNKKLNELIKRSLDTLELWKKGKFETVFQKYFSRQPK